MAKIKIKTSVCKGCLLCIAVCPKGALVASHALNAYGVAAVEVKHPGKCSGCAQCVLMCPENCITIEKKK